MRISLPHFAAIILLSFALPAAAAVKPGDILVADSQAGVLQIDGGDQSVNVLMQTIANGGSQVVRPIGVAIGPTGDIYVLDQGSGPSTATVWKVDPSSGIGSVVSSGGLFNYPVSIAVAPDGSIYVADLAPSGTDGSVIKIPAGGGAQSTFKAGGVSFGLAIDASGNVYLSRHLQYAVESCTAQGVLRWSKTTPDFLTASMAIDGNGLVYLFGTTTGVGGSDSFVLDPNSQTLTPFLPSANSDPPNGAVFLPNFDLVISLSGGLIPVVVLIHPDGSFGWRVGDYHISPVDRPWGLAVYGVRNGVTPSRSTTWGELKSRYRR